MEWMYKMISLYKINETVEIFSLAGDTFMHEIHSKQLRFNYGTGGQVKKEKLK